MRISDWSSDVCSSDLRASTKRLPGAGLKPDTTRCTCRSDCAAPSIPSANSRTSVGTPASIRTCTSVRSEEHTSELQSLMRISYAVFCLKKKTIPNQHTTTYITQYQRTTV